MLFALCPFWIAIPAAVAERGGGYLGRSRTLTRGYRLGIFAMLLVLFVVEWSIGRGQVRFAPGLGTVPRYAAIWTRQLLFSSLQAVFAVVGYHVLRQQKDGVDVTQLDKVFE